MIPTAPVKFILSVPVPALVSPPVPANAVATVNVPLFVRVTAVTVTLGIENVPVNACGFVSKVCIPVPALKVPLFVIPPLNVTGEFAAVLVHVPPEAIVTRPVKILVPVAEVIVRFPLVPPPTVVVPVTVNANAAAVKIVPFPTERLPVMPRPTTVVVDTVPLNVKLPLIVVVPVCKTSVPLPLKVRWK